MKVAARRFIRKSYSSEYKLSDVEERVIKELFSAHVAANPDLEDLSQPEFNQLYATFKLGWIARGVFVSEDWDGQAK